MKRRVIAMIMAAVVVAASVVGYRLSPPSQAAPAAVEQLKGAGTVNFGGGGYTGTISEAEDSLFVLLSSHRAEELLCQVFEGGTPEAKIYALCGLHYIAPRRFDHYAETFAATKIKVQTLSGCIAGEYDPAELVAAVRTNVFERYLPLRKEIEDNRRKYRQQLQRQHNLQRP